MNNQHKIVGAVLVAIAVVLFTSVFFWQRGQERVPVSPSGEVNESGKKLSIVASFYPFQNFAESVGGEYVSVRSIVPAGVEPHEYEPTSQDIVRAYEADIFLLNGAGMDPWAEKIRPELQKRGVAVVQMSEIVSKDSLEPHFWLDPVRVRGEIEAIRESLILRDPAHAAVYTENAARYMASLEGLDKAYQEGLKECAFDTIVTSHDAFGYLAQRYGFKTIAVLGISPEAEPSPRALADIAATVQALGLRYIFLKRW